MEPKLGKMLIFGVIFNCLDPILTIVAGLSVRDPFLTPSDKKDVSFFYFSDLEFFDLLLVSNCHRYFFLYTFQHLCVCVRV